MPGPAGQELRARRRRSAAFLLGSSKEAAKAPDGAVAAAKRSSSQLPAEQAKPAPVVVQAERVPDREPGCCRQLLEYIEDGSAGNTLSGFTVDANASFRVKLN